VVSHTAPGVDFKHLGWTFLIRAHGFGEAFLRTDVFDLSYSGKTMPPKDLIQSIGQELQGLERVLSPILTGESILNFVQLVAAYPAGYESFLYAVEKEGEVSSPLNFSLEDLFFLTVFGVNQSLQTFHDDKIQIKTRVLATNTYDGFLTEPHVVIAGVHRSGTTWLQSIANAILQEAGITPFEDKDSSSFYLNPSELPPLELIKAVKKLQLYSLPGQRFVGQAPHGYGGHLEAWLQGMAGFSNLRVLNIVRDPRNVFLSSRAYFGRIAVPPFLLVSRYLSAQRTYRDRCRARGACEIRYETLLAEPYAEIRRIADFMEVPLGDQQLHNVVEATRFETQTKGRAYGELKDGDAHRGGSDWRKELSTLQKLLINVVLGRKLAAFGYPDHGFKEPCQSQPRMKQV